MDKKLEKGQQVNLIRSLRVLKFEVDEAMTDILIRGEFDYLHIKALEDNLEDIKGLYDTYVKGE